MNPSAATEPPYWSGTGWYRTRVKIPAGLGSLSLCVPAISTSYELYADGEMIVAQGAFPPHPRVELTVTKVVEMSSNKDLGPRTVTVALRVWNWPGWSSDTQPGPNRPFQIGKTELVEQAEKLRNDGRRWRSDAEFILTILESLAALTALALFFIRIQDREYLWFALALSCSVANRVYTLYGMFNSLEFHRHNLTLFLLQFAGEVAQAAFYYRLLKARRNWLFWIMIASFSIAFVIPFLQFWDLSSELIIIVSAYATSLPFTVWLLVLLFYRALTGFPDARFLAIPALISQAAGIYGVGAALLESLGVNVDASWISVIVTFPFVISGYEIGDFLFLAGMLAILIYRFTRTRGLEETYERERSAARIVQQLLIPEAIPFLPGFSLSSVYKPANEVSGDFFQVIPLPGSGSTLIAIGDVSGKGLPAALMVSLAVGTLRTYAEMLLSPAEILRGLNRRLHGHSSGGFTTCLILRADPDGTLTIANAGHLPPYTNNKEIAVEAGLPLGILPDVEYEECTNVLPPDEFITLLTDGVLEARNSNGELFGFERTQSISSKPASEIAITAQVFGQDDDITVLQLRRLAD